MILAIAGILALCDWIAVERQARTIEYVFKPATLAALIVVAASTHPVDPVRRTWFLAALALSLAGDVFLMLPSDAFVPGLGSFLLAHIAYAAGFLHAGVPRAIAIALPAVLLAISPVAFKIIGAVRREHAPLTTPVVTYMLVIAVMVASAFATHTLVNGAGAALLFLASDSMIAWSRFVRPFPHARLAIMVTYHLAQAGLVLSLAHA